MALKLEFANKYRLWSDLLQANTARIFVSSEAPPLVGARVSVELAIEGLQLRIVLIGVVVARRRRSQRFTPGVFVSFPPEEIEKCRRFLGLSLAPVAADKGRKTARVDCELELRFVRPALAERCAAKNLSETGLLGTCGAQLSFGQRVEVELALSDGGAVTLPCDVSWSRPEVKLVGLRFAELDEAGRQRIRACIARLSDRRAPEAPSPPKIVIADDEPAILDLVTRALSPKGYELHRALRGDLALGLVRELKPRVVLLDVLMPGIDGVDICKAIRSDVDTADTAVIFFSALDQARLHEVADEAGATDYLVKPVEIAELVRMVELYLS